MNDQEQRARVRPSCHTCSDPHEQPSQHDHLEGACSAAEAEQDCSRHHKDVIHQEGLLPWGARSTTRDAQVQSRGS